MSSFEITGVPIDELNVFLAGAHPDPFRILGPHRVGDDLVVRVFRPDAKEVSIVAHRKAEQRFAADRLRPEGFFQATLPGMKRDIDYHVHLTGWDESAALVRDPYSYGLIMGEMDLHLFAEGNHLRLYDQFGAHLRKIGDTEGVYFGGWGRTGHPGSVVGASKAGVARGNGVRGLARGG